MKLVTRIIETLTDIADHYEVIVLDQWGVLHDGCSPYPEANKTLNHLASAGHRLAVLSNSGKRAKSNADRISQMGFSANLFDTILTSGEVLWQDINKSVVQHRIFFPIERTVGDSIHWAKGLDVDFTTDLKAAQAILLMGLPDDTNLAEWQRILNGALDLRIPMYCSNPDISSPRGSKIIEISPGVLAHEFQKRGGEVFFYGKPYGHTFMTLQRTLGVKSSYILMVGDSLEHDIAGAHASGWDSLFVSGGIHRNLFAKVEPQKALRSLTREKNLPLPTYLIRTLK